MKPSELDMAELTLQFRHMYKNQGYRTCLQVLYELVLSIDMLCKVIQEEQNNEKKV